MVMTFTMWKHRTLSGVWRLCPWWPRLCRWFCWGQFRGSPDSGPAPICSRKYTSWPNHRLGTQFFEVPRLSLHTGSGHWSVPVVSLHRPFSSTVIHHALNGTRTVLQRWMKKSIYYFHLYHKQYYITLKCISISFMTYYTDVILKSN